MQLNEIHESKEYLMENFTKLASAFKNEKKTEKDIQIDSMKADYVSKNWQETVGQ